MKKWKFSYFFYEKCGEKKKKRDPVWNKISYVICSLFQRKGRDEWMYFFFIGFGSLGIDGAEAAFYVALQRGSF